jgi:hypothetical protein
MWLPILPNKPAPVTYYDYYGVTVFTRHDVIQVPLDHALVLNSPAIADWMRKNTSEDPNCVSGTACEQAMGAAMFYNVKEFFHAYSEPPQNVINVVLLRRVVALEADQSEAEEAWGVAGLGLSQELLNSVSGSDLGTTSLADVLDETNFSPTIFIGVNLVDFVLPTPDMVIAHEFGHAYGLEHLEPQTYGANLMNPSAAACNLPLNSSSADDHRAGDRPIRQRPRCLEVRRAGVPLLRRPGAGNSWTIVRARIAKHALLQGTRP